MKALYTLLAVMICTICTASAQTIADNTDLEASEVDALIKDYEDTLLWATPEEEGIVEYIIEVEEGDSITVEEVEDALLALQRDLVDYASKYIGSPYRYGATGPKRFDCSGFTSFVFNNFGYDIGRTSRNQSARGEKVELADVRVGDLMFFSRPKGGNTVGHVGMVVDVDPDEGTLKFIHASSSKGVTIQQFPDNGYFNRRFLHVRRVVGHQQGVSSAISGMVEAWYTGSLPALRCFL